jgi:para-nitrobenzyl esterase
MKNIYLSLLSIGVFTLSFAQNNCGNGRYTDKIFSTLVTSSNIVYGSNISLNGSNTQLKLDVYEPAGDTQALRPLLIWAHGGSFVGGSKTGSDVLPLAQDFAKMGYVTASIDYRIGMQGVPFPGPDSVGATETVIRAVHDARAAVRFFRKNVATGGNTYKIDTNHIYFGGVSAGAIIALHLAYLDKISEMPTYVDTTKPGLGGGIEGNSGNPGYLSTVRAVINSAGAIRDSAWMETANDIPLISFHGTNDGTVPYGTATIYMLGQFPIMEVDGSESVHIRANNLGMNNCFVSWPGQDHVPHVGNAQYYDSLMVFSKYFLREFVCGEQFDCTYKASTGIADADAIKTVNAFPVPADEYVWLNNPLPKGADYTLNVYDNMGRLLSSNVGKNNTPTIKVERENLPAGVYFVQLYSTNESYSAKVVFR